MSNPLLEISPKNLPHFSAIRPNHVVPAVEQYIDTHLTSIKQAANGDGSWAAVVDQEVNAGNSLYQVWSCVAHLNAVENSAELREAYAEGLALMTEHQSRRQQDGKLFAAYQALRDRHTLTAQQQRIVEKEVLDFELSGVGLPAAGKRRYQTLVNELSELSRKFSDNALDATQAWSLTIDQVDQLSGLPPAELRLLAEQAAENEQSGWLINLSYPSYQAIMKYADDATLRQRVYQAYITRAAAESPSEQGDSSFDNYPLMLQILRARSELAQLLGYANYAEYALAKRMAASAQQVSGFLQDLATAAKAAAGEQCAELQAYAVANGGAQELAPWDVAYWSEKMRQARFSVSDQELKPYFVSETVVDGLFSLVERLFGIQFKEDSGVDVWHPAVRFFWVYNADGERIAGLYCDFYLRQDKRSGAWMDTLQSRCAAPQGRQLPIAFLTCNFAAPQAGEPALLTHRDVETLFHELGHVLHHILTEVDYPQINGISGVEWDAVELPSQLLENWCWQAEVLRRLGRHYQTGAVIPDELIERLQAARHFQRAMFLVRQLEYALCDFELHQYTDYPEDFDIYAVARKVHQQVAVLPWPKHNRYLNTFGHIFAGGYAAGYYSYLWAEQLAADAWSRFEADGPLNPQVGEAFKNAVLAVGSSRPMLDSFKAFMQREPISEPLLRHYGIEE